MEKALTLLFAILLLSLAAEAQQNLPQGDWGYISLMLNPRRCFGVVLYKGENRLYTVDCHIQSDLLLWRYDPSTHQLQNKGLTLSYNTPHCLMGRELRNSKYLYLGPCRANLHFRFLPRGEGHSYSLVSEADARYCVDFSGNAQSRGSLYGYYYTCHSITYRNTDQWFKFTFHSRYRGADLDPSPADPSVADGNWGHFVVRATQSCYAIDAVSQILEQRHCIDSDDGQRFRYDPVTLEIKNWKYPLNSGGKGCLTRSGTQFYVTRCTGSTAQKFVILEAASYDGTFQQIKIYDDHRKCIDVWGTYTGYRKIYSATCQSFSHTSDQFIDFKFWKSSKVCPVGQYLNHNACKYCPAGTYNDVRGAITCKTCPRGYTSPKGATSCTKINNCPAGTFMNARKICQACPINTFNNKKGQVRCTACAKGYHTKGTGSTVCVRNVNNCPAGTFLNSRSLCQACPVNTYNNKKGQVRCTACAKGYHTKGTGSKVCVRNSVCPVGTFINGNMCTKCPINTFSNVQNAATCNKCPAGSYTKTTGSSKCISRTFCGPGKFHNGHFCQVCPRNTYSNEVGNTYCKSCPEGYETKGTGAKFCTRKNNCQPGSFFSLGKNTCIACPRNFYTDKPHQTACTKCPAGTGTATTGSKKCVKVNYCKPGKFHNGKQCVVCPKNTYSDQVGAWQCKKCKYGTMTDKKGSTKCRTVIANDCTPGRFYNGKACVVCKKNTYTDARGAKYCKHCPSGYETKEAGAKSCVKKQLINVITEAETRTVKCYNKQISPPCLLKCRFKTNTGVRIKNKAVVKFYRLRGSSWYSIGTVAYNPKANWFSTKVAQLPDNGDAGVYKCEARYGGSVGSAQMEVVMLSKHNDKQ